MCFPILINKIEREEEKWYCKTWPHKTLPKNINGWLKYAPFYEKGVSINAYQVFGDELDIIIDELNEVLVAQVGRRWMNVFRKFKNKKL